jgi:glucan phosphorylase
MTESTTEQVKERVSDGAQQAKQQTRERVRQQVDARSSQTGEQMTKTGSALRQTAQQLRGDRQETQAKVLDAVAERTERLGRYLSETDGDRLLRDAERVARQRPWVVAGGGAILGFLAARFTKASSSRRYEANGSGMQGGGARGV